MVRPGRYAIVNSAISSEDLEKEVARIMGEAGTADYLEGVAPFETGSIICGIVTRIDKDDVIVDVKYKAEGLVPLADFLDTGFPKVGETVEVFVEEIDDEAGEILLSKRKADRIRGWERVMDKYDVGDVVVGRAIRKIKGGLLVDIGVPVFLPASQVDIRRIADVGDFVGRDLECKIIKIDKERRNIVLSRRKVMEEAREQKKSNVLSGLVKGEVRKGVVKNITDFGAFVDLGGIDGLLHITDMSWGRINHPSEVVSIDQELEVKILDYDLDRERISLGLKQVKENPWDEIESRFPVGCRVKGPVVNIMPYGAFVKLADGIEGLVHVSEMSWTRQVNHPSEVVSVGDEVEVVVLDINKDKQELSLGIKQTEENPWMQVVEKYPVGSTVSGTVRNMTNYGAFIELEEGIDGLLHVNDMSWTKKISHPSAMLNKGDSISAMVLSVDQERKRVALGLKQLERNPWDNNIPDKYHPGDIVKGTITKLTNFGAFVALEDELEGLLHISELSDNKIEKPEDVVEVGQEVTVMVINVDTDERKIGLSLRATTGADPEQIKREILEKAQEESNSGEATREEIAKYTHTKNEGYIPGV